MRILITGGGTGGHLAIAKSLRDAAVSAGHRTVFVGSEAGQDRGWFEDDKVFESVHFLDTSGVVNKRGIGKLLALLKTLKATFRALAYVRKADLVISVGGFSAAPASFAAALLRKPYFIHEQNAEVGRLNRLLRPLAKGFYSSYEEDAFVRDYPVRTSFFDLARKRTEIATIIFLGGSQGAQFINELALRIAPVLKKKGIRIIHQAGKREKERVQEAYKALGIEAEVFDFRSDLDQLMHQSDFAVSRSGASTLWELCASNLPALYIPYPYAAGDHQFHNAAFLLEHGASWVCRQEDDPYSHLLQLLDKDMEEASTRLRSLIHKDGAGSIIKEIQRCMNA